MTKFPPLSLKLHVADLLSDQKWPNVDVIVDQRLFVVSHWIPHQFQEHLHPLIDTSAGHLINSPESVPLITIPSLPMGVD